MEYAGDDYDLIVGKSPIETGLAELYQPTDIHSRSSLGQPLHETELGIWQVTYRHFFDDDSLSFSLLPFDTQTPPRPENTRWNKGDLEEVLTKANLPATGEVLTKKRRLSPENMGYLLHYAGVRQGYDFYATLYHGASPYFVFTAAGEFSPTERPQYYKTKPSVFATSGGVSYVYKSWQTYAEGFFQFNRFGEDEDLMKYVSGVKYKETRYAAMLGFDEISPTLEYAGEWIPRHTYNPNILAGSTETRINRNNLISALDIQIDSHWDAGAYLNYNLSHHDHLKQFSLEYQPNDNLTLSTTLSYFTGSDGTVFGRWEENDNVDVGLSYLF